MKRKYFFLIVFVILVCTSIVVLWSNREQPLYSVLPNDDMITCVSNGYYDGMESVVVGAIPRERIVELLDLTTVKKATSYKAMPSPCFEIRAAYDNEIYIIVVGADKTVSVAPIGELDSPTFWVDMLFLYIVDLFLLDLPIKYRRKHKRQRNKCVIFYTF